MALLRRSTKEKPAPEPAINVPVFTADGTRCGFVKSTHGGYIELEGGQGDSFWLSTVYIKSADDSRIQLTFPDAELETHRLSEPGLEPERDPDAASARDAVLSDAEQLAQRERMEKELLRQRGTIDTGLDS